MLMTVLRKSPSACLPAPLQGGGGQAPRDFSPRYSAATWWKLVTKQPASVALDFQLVATLGDRQAADTPCRSMIPWPGIHRSWKRPLG